MSMSLVGLSKELHGKVFQTWMETGQIGTMILKAKNRLGLLHCFDPEMLEIMEMSILKELGKCISMQLRMVRGVCRSWLQAVDRVTEEQWQRENNGWVKEVLTFVIWHHRILCKEA